MKFRLVDFPHVELDVYPMLCDFDFGRRWVHPARVKEGDFFWRLEYVGPPAELVASGACTQAMLDRGSRVARRYRRQDECGDPYFRTTWNARSEDRIESRARICRFKTPERALRLPAAREAIAWWEKDGSAPQTHSHAATQLKERTVLSDAKTVVRARSDGVITHVEWVCVQDESYRVLLEEVAAIARIDECRDVLAQALLQLRRIGRHVRSIQSTRPQG